ncbi:hypothetical protein CNMCM6106_001616 [Aspergillus hiratsukae]|uniref:Suppressor of anucleate metulae protein B n=1 Tax=Aspergillus hiratsukae TaxID=1194566 RepID=A0A8H6Q379_9EURO|nr:hypothetical protein CNMCM6106_001616 [Aspergillus hiratsukae]
MARDGIDGRGPSHAEAKRNFEKQIVLSPSSHSASAGFGARTRVLRASDVLLSLAGKTESETVEDSPGVESFAETVRLFPPLRNDDGGPHGATDSKCPDCDAVFSSPSELKQHYLTRFCPGAAVAIYLMTRDRLITRGYRMEKRFLPVNSRPLRFFCEHCEKQFTVGNKDEIVDRQRDTPSFTICKNCGEECNISYEPVLNDPRDDISLRDIQKDRANGAHSRSPSIVQMSLTGSKFHMATNTAGEQSFAQRARKLRDSWSFRKISQSDEDELIAVSFAGLYDLERVHAPNGIFQQFAATAEPQPTQSERDCPYETPNNVHIIGSKTSGMALCEEENDHYRSEYVDSQGNLVEDQAQPAPLSSRRQSFLQRIFGRTIPKGLSRAKSASNRGRKLLKRANTVRLSFTQKGSKNESDTSLESGGSSSDATTAKTQRRADGCRAAVSEAEYMTLLRNCQNIFVHIQHLSGGAMVHDASGRQRLLQMDEVAQLFLQLKNELAASTVYSKALITRMRADAALKQGNSKAAVVEFHDALRTLDSAPGLDTERLSRASILHSMGHAYRNLDMAAESEACYLEALGLYKRSFGRDHPTNFAVLHDLGALCEKDGYATEAAALYERSFAGRLKTLGQHAPETLSSMQDLASLKVSLGDLESALLLLERAVPALDTVFGLQNETTLNAMNKLSLLYQKLGLVKESRMICGKTIPHCKTIFGVASAITRDAAVRYIQGSDNFDFPPEIMNVLDHYRNSRDPEALRVVHRLGRSYMDAGLNRDAADLFESLFEDLLVVRGPEAPETFDALSALCVSREHLDSVDKAILSYHQLVQMASSTPEDHHSRKRIGYAQKRIVELKRRREVLATERREWGLHEPGKCENCGTSTKILCNTCKIFRFCSEPCHKASLQAHLPYCIPSVSLRESKSLAVKPRCPSWIRDQALSKIRPLDRTKTVDVLASYTFYFDPRNFTTFRMKLSSLSNTIIIFSLDSDIQFTTLDSSSSVNTSSSRPTTSVSTSSTTPRGIQWLTPERQEAICYIPPDSSSSSTDAAAKYLLVSPGKEMFKSAIDKRIGMRGANGEKEHFLSLALPDSELIEYAQGLLLTGYLEEAFMYVIEWGWK